MSTIAELAKKRKLDEFKGPDTPGRAFVVANELAGYPPPAATAGLSYCTLRSLVDYLVNGDAISNYGILVMLGCGTIKNRDSVPSNDLFSVPDEFIIRRDEMGKVTGFRLNAEDPKEYPGSLYRLGEHCRYHNGRYGIMCEAKNLLSVPRLEQYAGKWYGPAGPIKVPEGKDADVMSREMLKLILYINPALPIAANLQTIFNAAGKVALSIETRDVEEKFVDEMVAIVEGLGSVQTLEKIMELDVESNSKNYPPSFPKFVSKIVGTLMRTCPLAEKIVYACKKKIAGCTNFLSTAEFRIPLGKNSVGEHIPSAECKGTSLKKVADIAPEDKILVGNISVGGTGVRNFLQSLPNELWVTEADNVKFVPKKGKGGKQNKGKGQTYNSCSYSVYKPCFERKYGDGAGKKGSEQVTKPTFAFSM